MTRSIYQFQRSTLLIRLIHLLDEFSFLIQCQFVIKPSLKITTILPHIYYFVSFLQYSFFKKCPSRSINQSRIDFGSRNVDSSTFFAILCDARQFSISEGSPPNSQQFFKILQNPTKGIDFKNLFFLSLSLSLSATISIDTWQR